jgi:hypothetical protein
MKPAWRQLSVRLHRYRGTQSLDPDESNEPATVENWLTDRSCLSLLSGQAAPLRKLTRSCAPKAITARLPGDRNGAFRQLSRAKSEAKNFSLAKRNLPVTDGRA